MTQRLLICTVLAGFFLLSGMRYPPHGNDADAYRCAGGLVSKGDRVGDVMEMCGEPLREDGRDTFGVFVNGGMSPPGAYFYLRALSMMGFGIADKMCAQILDSFAARLFDGGAWAGTEAWSWEGLRTGYEGTLSHSYHVLLACAQHLGLVETLDPEWWPAA